MFLQAPVKYWSCANLKFATKISNIRRVFIATDLKKDLSGVFVTYATNEKWSSLLFNLKTGGESRRNKSSGGTTSTTSQQDAAVNATRGRKENTTLNTSKRHNTYTFINRDFSKPENELCL